MSIPATRVNQIIRPRLIHAGNKLQLHCRFQQKDLAKMIFGAKWNKEQKVWEYPLTPSVYASLVKAFPRLEVAPGVTEALEEAAEREETFHHIKAAGWTNVEPIADMPVKVPEGWSVFRHQILGFNLGMVLDKAFLLLPEVGTGKSLIVTAIIGAKQFKRVLIVAPLSAVMGTWYFEDRGRAYGQIPAHADFPYKAVQLGDKFTSEQKTFKIYDLINNPGDCMQIVTVNYDSVWRIEEELAKWKPECIIADEVHRIKGCSARQTKALWRLGSKSKFNIGMTGTPIGNEEPDVYAIFKFLDPSIFGNSKDKFINQYFEWTPSRWSQYKKEIKRIRPEKRQEFMDKFHSITFRVLKKDCLDLPDQVDEFLQCDWDTKARKIYDDLRQKKVAVLEAMNKKEVVVHAGALEMKLSQLCGGFLDEELVNPAKLKVLGDSLEDLFESGQKALIFCRFIPEYYAIINLLNDMKIDNVAIRGGVKNRGELVNKFQNEKTCRAFVGQEQAVAESLTLTAASVSYFYSYSESFLRYEQLKGRNNRPGQTEKMTCFHLVMKNSVDEKAIRNLQRKKDLSTAIADWKEFFDVEGR